MEYPPCQPIYRIHAFHVLTLFQVGCVGSYVDVLHLGCVLGCSEREAITEQHAVPRLGQFRRVTLLRRQG
jgi:hypothetical protein